MTDKSNCGNCGEVLGEDSKACPKCGSTKKVYSMEFEDGIIFSEGRRISHKRKGLGEIHEQLIRRKSSLNPNLSKGVVESRAIDREKGTYDQVVTDIRTGAVIHEEHMTLKKHNEDKGKKSK